MQAAVLYDVISRKRNFIDTFFHDFLTFQWNTERKRKIMKDEKKPPGVVDESSSEQQSHHYLVQTIWSHNS